MVLRRIFLAAVLGVTVVSLPQPAAATSGPYIITGKEYQAVDTSVNGGYELSDAAERGTVDFDGPSLGAFTVSPGGFAFYGVETDGDYDSTMFFGPSLLDGSLLQSGTFSYPDGTASLSTLPFSWTIWLPNPTDLGTATQFTLTGSQSLSFSITDTSTYSRYNASGIDMDPITGNPVDWTISGQFTPGGQEISGASYVNTLSYVFRGTVTPEPGSLVLGLTGMAACWLQRRRVGRASADADRLPA